MNDGLQAARAKITELENQVAAVSARLAQVRIALEKYGEHGEWCDFMSFEEGEKPCSCGLAEVLALSAQTKEGS